MCLLPATAGVTRDVRRLAGRVRQGGGTIRVLPMAFADLHRFQAWLAKIEARDYFRAAGGEAARSAVAGAVAALAAFENAVLDAETSGSAPAAGPGRSRLKAVDGP